MIIFFMTLNHKEGGGEEQEGGAEKLFEKIIAEDIKGIKHSIVHTVLKDYF